MTITNPKRLWTRVELTKVKSYKDLKEIEQELLAAYQKKHKRVPLDFVFEYSYDRVIVPFLKGELVVNDVVEPVAKFRLICTVKSVGSSSFTHDFLTWKELYAAFSASRSIMEVLVDTLMIFRCEFKLLEWKIGDWQSLETCFLGAHQPPELK